MSRHTLSAAARGYGYQHQKLRALWLPIVTSGGVMCHAKLCLMPTREIKPGDAWDLGHTDDRARWTGPEHARCNRADGARRRNAKKLIRQRRRWAL